MALSLNTVRSGNGWSHCHLCHCHKVPRPLPTMSLVQTSPTTPPLPTPCRRAPYPSSKLSYLPSTRFFTTLALTKTKPKDINFTVTRRSNSTKRSHFFLWCRPTIRYAPRPVVRTTLPSCQTLSHYPSIHLRSVSGLLFFFWSGSVVWLVSNIVVMIGHFDHYYSG